MKRSWLGILSLAVLALLLLVVRAVYKPSKPRPRLAPSPTASLSPSPSLSLSPSPSPSLSRSPTPSLSPSPSASLSPSPSASTSLDPLPSPADPNLGGVVSKDAQSRARAVILTAARKCLDDVQKTQPELGGEVVVTYTLVIDGDRGHVMTPFVTAPDVPSPTLLECIKQAAQKVTTSIDPAIDKPGKLRVRLPLALNPKIIPP